MFITKVRRVGTALGVLIPAREVKKLELHEGEEVVVKEMEKPRAKSGFGIWKGMKPFKHEPDDHVF
jgi:hypothetical protein